MSKAMTREELKLKTEPFKARCKVTRFSPYPENFYNDRISEVKINNYKKQRMMFIDKESIEVDLGFNNSQHKFIIDSKSYWTVQVYELDQSTIDKLENKQSLDLQDLEQTNQDFEAFCKLQTKFKETTSNQELFTAVKVIEQSGKKYFDLGLKGKWCFEDHQKDSYYHLQRFDNDVSFKLRLYKV